MGIRPTNFKFGTQMEYDDLHQRMRGDLKSHSAHIGIIIAHAYEVNHNGNTVAEFAVLLRYPRYYRGNGIEIHGITAVMGLELTVFPP